MAKNLYVGNLSYSTTDDSLREAFEAFGEVVSASVIKDNASGRSKGFGFVEMATDEAASAAIEGLNGQTLDGRALRVAEARPRQPREGGSGYRGGGDRRSGGGGDRHW